MKGNETSSKIISARFRVPSPQSRLKVNFKQYNVQERRRSIANKVILGFLQWVWRLLTTGCKFLIGAVCFLFSWIREPFSRGLRFMWRNTARRKLLLLDLDGTLVNCNSVLGAGEDSFQVKESWYHVDRRPFLTEFLDFAAHHFDLAVFTASQEEYAEGVIRILQLSLPLFSRSACTRTERGFIKNLKKEFQDMSQVILLDDSPESYLEQPRNVIRISTWKDGADSELLRCISILKRVHTSFSVHEVDLNKW